jgi:hypothetical protein
MNNLSKEIRGTLKRLCPYVGSNIPNSVREKASDFWAPYDPDKYAGWQWDDGSGFYQCELELCDMDADYIDPEGYVAIRPLGQNKCALIFAISARWTKGFHSRDLIFQTMEEAKRYLDALLAAETPEIPLDTK